MFGAAPVTLRAACYRRWFRKVEDGKQKPIYVLEELEDVAAVQVATYVH